MDKWSSHRVILGDISGLGDWFDGHEHRGPIACDADGRQHMAVGQCGCLQIVTWDGSATSVVIDRRVGIVQLDGIGDDGWCWCDRLGGTLQRRGIRHGAGDGGWSELGNIRVEHPVWHWFEWNGSNVVGIGELIDDEASAGCWVDARNCSDGHPADEQLDVGPDDGLQCSKDCANEQCCIDWVHERDDRGRRSWAIAIFKLITGVWKRGGDNGLAIREHAGAEDDDRHVGAACGGCDDRMACEQFDVCTDDGRVGTEQRGEGECGYDGVDECNGCGVGCDGRNVKLQRVEWRRRVGWGIDVVDIRYGNADEIECGCSGIAVGLGNRGDACWEYDNGADAGQRRGVARVAMERGDDREHECDSRRIRCVARFDVRVWSCEGLLD